MVAQAPRLHLSIEQGRSARARRAPHVCSSVSARRLAGWLRARWVFRRPNAYVGIPGPAAIRIELMGGTMSTSLCLIVSGFARGS